MTRKKTKIEIILEAVEAEGFALARRSLEGNGGSIEILYIQQLTDRVSLMDFVIRPLSLYLGQRSNATYGLKAKTIAQNVLYVDAEQINGEWLNGIEWRCFVFRDLRCAAHLAQWPRWHILAPIKHFADKLIDHFIDSRSCIVALACA